MRETAGNLADMQAQMSALFQTDQNNGTAPGQGAFASFVAPMEVTDQRKRQIKTLPVATSRSKNKIWYVHVITEQEHEGTSLTCQVYQVTKEHESNGLPLPESDGLGMSLAMCAVLDPTNSMSARPRLLLGTIAKACMSPGSMSIANMSGSRSSAAANAFDIRLSRPRKVLFQTRGEVEMLAPDLQALGITKLDVAENAIVRSLELHNSAMNDAQYESANNPLTNPDPAALGRTMLAQADAISDPYVDEEPVPFGRWSPPTEPGDLPARWFAIPPLGDEYRPTALLGWRTNLERAVLREDVSKVKAIVSKRDASDIREYVECRMLLTKCAKRGLLVGCKLLLEECNASVEGAQAPDAEPWWIEVQNSSGNYGSLTPLHQAARDGTLESVKLLLECGADINRIDKSNVRGSALHHAVSGGQMDCCRVLCENGADHTYQGQGGDALAISELCAEGDVYRGRVQEKMQQTLREFDTRCSYCRHPNPTKNCPCQKECYCDADCQRKRWKKHKKYHKQILSLDE